MHDSTTPTTTAKATIAATKHAPVQQQRPERDRNDELDQDGADDEELERRAVEHCRQGRPAVVEHHDLVDHGQLQVRVRVVERDARVLRQHDHEQARHDHDQRGSRPPPGRADARREHAGQLQRAAELHERQEPQEHRRLGQAREGHLARGAHPLEGRARVEGRGGREEAAQREQVREQDEVAREVHGSAHAAEWQDERRAHRRRQGHRGPGEEDPARGPADDHLLAEELREIEVRLEHRRADPAAEPGLGLDDHPLQQRRHCEQHQDVQDSVGDAAQDQRADHSDTTARRSARTSIRKSSNPTVAATT